MTPRTWRAWMTTAAGRRRGGGCHEHRDRSRHSQPGMLTTFGAPSASTFAFPGGPSTFDAVTIAERQREGGGAPSQRRPVRARAWQVPRITGGHAHAVRVARPDPRSVTGACYRRALSRDSDAPLVGPLLVYETSPSRPLRSRGRGRRPRAPRSSQVQPPIDATAGIRSRGISTVKTHPRPDRVRA